MNPVEDAKIIQFLHENPQVKAQLLEKIEQHHPNLDWYPEKPAKSWSYTQMITVPLKALWWTGKTIVKVQQVVQPLVVPIGIAVSLSQSPLPGLAFKLLKK